MAPQAAPRGSSTSAVLNVHGVVLRQEHELDTLRERLQHEAAERAALREQASDLSAVFTRAQSDQERTIHALRSELAAAGVAAQHSEDESVARLAAARAEEQRLYTACEESNIEAHALRRRAEEAELLLRDARDDASRAELTAVAPDDADATRMPPLPPPAEEIETALVVVDDARVASAVEQRDRAIEELERAHSLRSALADVQIETLTQLAAAQLEKEEAESQALVYRSEAEHARSLLTDDGRAAEALRAQAKSAAIVAINRELGSKVDAAQSEHASLVATQQQLERQLLASERLRRVADEEVLQARASVADIAREAMARDAALCELRAERDTEREVVGAARSEIVALEVADASERAARAAAEEQVTGLRAARESLVEAAAADAAQHAALLIEAQRAASAQLSSIVSELEVKHFEVSSFTVTFCANPANDFTCPPSCIII